MSKERLAQVWPEWQVLEQLGRGSYGTVYKAVRRDSHIQSYAAIKVITIPTDHSEIDSLRSEGLSAEGARTYFRGIVNDFVDEIRLMESLKGVQNIVSVEDYKVMERQDSIGWDIFIRMELLTPFNTYLRTRQMTEQEVIKLGVDICTALEICGKRNVVHRDIKPENIFINDFGYFKLGDFGIARKLENATGGLSQKGTFNYMAPEVATGTKYDARVDLYSLGIVLYRLLNGNRLPFIETEQQLLNPNARKAAVERRIRGERMNPPCQASPQVAAVIMRACAYNPEVRFPNATAMKDALIRAGMGLYTESVDLDQTMVAQGVAPINPVPAAGGFVQVQRPNMSRSTPPVVRTNVSRSTPPAVQTNVSRSTPPVVPNSANRSTPPVVPNYVNRSTPPVVPNNVNRTVPGNPNATYKTQPQEKSGLNKLCLVSFLLCPVLLILAMLCNLMDQEEAVFALSLVMAIVGLVPLAMSILGIRKVRTQNQRGKGFALAAFIVSLVLDCLALDNMFVALEDMDVLDYGMDLVFSGIFCGVLVVVSVLAYILAGRKKKA